MKFKKISFLVITAFCLILLSFTFIKNVTQNNNSKNFTNESVKAYISGLLNISNDSLIINSRHIVTASFFNRLNPSKDLLFINEDKLSNTGDTLVKIIKTADQFGLYPQSYAINSIDSLLNSKEVTDSAAIKKMACLEIFLTDAYLKMGAHLNKGRFSKDTILLEWNPDRLNKNWVEVLQTGISKNNMYGALCELEPKSKRYVQLKAYLKKYKKDNDTISWQPILPEYYQLANISALLKQRLIFSRDYDSTLKSSDTVKLVKAIKSFQKKQHLENDGKLGKYTRQALALTKENIIEYIQMDMERCRWEMTTLPKQYAIVNIPSADFTVYGWHKKHKEDTISLYSKTVVGKPETPTPMLTSKINSIIIYPYWNVPFKIAWKEILPMVKRDTNYLYKKNFEVINGKGEVVASPGKLNWKRYNKDNLPVRFRQRIGEDNSLGVCKFNFNNKYGVYLHDTDNKGWFSTESRHQSHGCMRLEKYKDLAIYLIKHNELDIPEDSLNVYFGKQEQRKIDLEKQVPLFVKYNCVVFDEKSRPSIFLDKYRYNEQMTNLLYTSAK